jgi:hypothetical protein
VSGVHRIILGVPGMILGESDEVVSYLIERVGFWGEHSRLTLLVLYFLAVVGVYLLRSRRLKASAGPGL